jgi:hypothetical protein
VISDLDIWRGAQFPESESHGADAELEGGRGVGTRRGAGAGRHPSRRPNFARQTAALLRVIAGIAFIFFLTMSQLSAANTFNDEDETKCSTS